MALFLVQHAKSLSKEIDPERGLTEKGISELKGIAHAAKKYRIKVSQIKHSGKKRAFQTAEIINSILGSDGGIHQISGLNPLDDVVPLASTLDTDDNLMFVGHMPFLGKLVSYLITGAVERPVFKFQNGGILCLDISPDTQTWIIKWALLPKIE